MGRLAGWMATALTALCLLGQAWAKDESIALPVPRVTIYPGDSIVADALEDRLFVARTVARGTVLESRDGLVGKVARRTLLPLKPIPLNGIREPYAVNQGKPAQLVFKAEGLTITSTAIVLQNGMAGEVVSARNLDSGIIIKGMVQADGTLRVDGL